MKKRQKLIAGITLINKNFKKTEFYHYFEELNNVIIIPKINNHFILVRQKREPINKKNYEFQWAGLIRAKVHLMLQKENYLRKQVTNV